VKFTEIVDAAKALLQRKDRVTYRGLAREFDLDDATLQDLVDELITAERVATDEGGKVLVWAGPANAVAPEAAPAVEGERRQLTVMFCDLVGSTALSEQLDPEDLHELVSAYQHAARQVIQRYEGYVAQYLGDGILAYFGYPAAHEDDAMRGVRAGLDILADIRALKSRVPVQVRIGLHTGPVVIGSIGEGSRAEQLALGRTPNIAARVQGAASPHTLAISGDTLRLVQGLFECEDLGTQDLKGIAEPVRLYQVVQQGRARSRFDVLLEQGLTPMQGREREMQTLLQRWRLARGGEGQVVVLSGEPGIGKSRLIQALSQRSGEDHASRMAFRCSPFHVSSPLFPVVDQLSRALQAGPEDPPGVRWERLEQLLEGVGLRDDVHLFLFAALLSIPLPAGFAEPTISREERKARTLQALATWLLTLAVEQPMLVIFEDLQWADPSTLDMLSLCVGRIRDAAILVVMTCRPDFVPPWPTGGPCLELPLTRLSPHDIRRVATEIAGKPLPADVLEQLVHKTDGVPLYVEEMTKDLLESNLMHDVQGQFELRGALPNMAVPFSLQDSLASRLDRLGPARRLAETASVLGREFSFSWIQALSDSDEQTLVAGLQRLCDAGILLRQPGPQDTVYIFRHALMQDAAYNSLLIRRRQQVHARVAQLLTTEWAGQAASQPALVAHHYTEAGLAPQAIVFWRRAGLQAVESSANKEAIQHVSKALEVLKTLPEGPERDRGDLSLLLALGVPLAVTSSWAAPEVRWASERAFELCEALGETDQLFPAMYGVWSSRQVQAEYGAARRLAQQLLALAERTRDDGFLLQAHRACGIICLHTGEFLEALTHCEAGWALYDSERHHSHVAMYWLDPGVGCLCYGAWALMFLGRLDQALARVNQAVDLARRGGHAFSLAYALFFCTVLLQLRREPGPTRERAQELTVLAQQHGFPILGAWASLMLGCALVEEGRAREGSVMIREGERAIRSGGARVSRSGALTVLANAYDRAGDREPGLATVAEALDFVAQSEEHFYEAELHRLRGELLLQRGAGPAQADAQGQVDAQEQAQRCFEQCMSIARQQHAGIWVLRGATSLARLHALRGERIKARDAIGDVLGSFTEGLATPDLQEARALYDSLG
jgi:class 3 adenylate cyclase/predicted ATPase